ncbi:MAG: class I SAM-dependent methyltransferase [Frankiaceae bacterium]
MALTVALAEALAAPPGQALLAELTTRLAAGEPELRVATELRARHEAALVAAAAEQVELRGRAAGKLAAAGSLLLTRDGLEQASSERVARWRARRLVASVPPGAPLADLCCGIGGDLVTIGRQAGRPVLGVDRDPVHLRLAAHNAAVHGVAAELVESDVRAMALPPDAVALVDPARRSGGRRGGYEPPLAWCAGLAERVGGVVVKAAPGLDAGEVPPGWEMELVADRRELKEAVLWSPALATAARRASVLPAEASIAGDPARQPAVPVRPPGPYLLDPSPAVTRAGLVEQLAAGLGAWKVDDRVAFLCSDEPVRTPFARCLRVEASLPWHPRRLAAALRELDVGSVDVRRRGLAGDVDDIRRRLRLSGSRRAVVAMTRVADRPWAFVATAVDDAPSGPAGSVW